MLGVSDVSAGQSIRERYYMTTAKTFTCTAKCGTCGAVMNTAHGVPEEAKGQVTMSAPMVAFCEVAAHNSLSDVNWNLKLEWTEEVHDSQEGKATK